MEEHLNRATRSGAVPIPCKLVYEIRIFPRSHTSNAITKTPESQQTPEQTQYRPARTRPHLAAIPVQMHHSKQYHRRPKPAPPRYEPGHKV